MIKNIIKYFYALHYLLNRPINVSDLNLFSAFKNRLLFFFLPVFPCIWVMLVSYIFCILYLNNGAWLCDGGSNVDLYDLKVNLTKAFADFRINQAKVDCYTDLYSQLMDISRPNFRNFGLEESYINKINLYKHNMRECFAKTEELSDAIKKLQPGFKSPIRDIFIYPRVGR